MFYGHIVFEHTIEAESFEEAQDSFEDWINSNQDMLDEYTEEQVKDFDYSNLEFEKPELMVEGGE
jgi:hypothetical protein